MGNGQKVSAYISIFDDWDMLPEALESIDVISDEIVVVDGAYDWVAPQLDREDPSTSREEVYDCFSRYTKKLKIVKGLWRNEFEKRIAGFSACTNRYVMRSDADEIHFFDGQALNRFFASAKAVAQINMPTFITPHYFFSVNRGGERQSALFDRERIDPRSHLNWLWLVLPDNLKQEEVDAALLFEDCISFTAHLTSWRSPFSASSRALFYVMLWLRNNNGLSSLASLPHDFRSSLLGRDIVAGGPFVTDAGVVVPTPLSVSQTSRLAAIYRRHQDELSKLNESCKSGRSMMNGDRYIFNVSSPEQEKALGTRFLFSGAVESFEANVVSVIKAEPFVSSQDANFSVDGSSVSIKLPDRVDSLQRFLVIKPVVKSAEAMIGMKAYSEREQLGLS